VSPAAGVPVVSPPFGTVGGWRTPPPAAFG